MTMRTKKQAKIPLKEWLILGIGIVLFAGTEIALFFSGYMNLLLNTAMAFLIAAATNFITFKVKNKLKRIARAMQTLWVIVQVLPMIIYSAMLYVARYCIIFLLAIPKWLYRLVKSLPAILRGIIILLTIVALNASMVPLVGIYFTIYGMLLSLTGGAAKIMLRHYDAFGRRLLKPLRRYIFPEVIVAVLAIAMVAAVAVYTMNAVATAAGVASADTAMAAAGNGLSAMGTVASYLPVFAIVAIAVIILLILRYLLTGFQSFSAAGA